MSQEPNNHDHPSEKPNPPKERKIGFFGDLAQRSSGLPQNRSAPQREKSPWSYAGLGLQFAGTTALFAFMGLYLDHRFGWSPWGTLSLTMVGLVGGLYLLIKDSLKANRDETREKDRKP